MYYMLNHSDGMHTSNAPSNHDPILTYAGTDLCPFDGTQWSSCTVSCGVGTSTRISNDNPACRLQLEVRICKLRPCQMIFTHVSYCWNSVGIDITL